MTSPGVPLDVLHEDDALLVVNKPAGLVCHPTKDGEWSSLIGRVRLHLGETPGDSARDGRLVNRLDRETSGLVVIARTREAASELGRLFMTRQVDKRYLAIVEGHVAGDALHLTGSIGDDEESPVAIKARVRGDGVHAETVARVVERFVWQEVPMTLLEVEPHTGRKHQIRVHLGDAGFPIVGDKLYGADPLRYLRFVERRQTEADLQALRVPFHALHAWRLRWQWRNQDWEFEAPWPARLEALRPFMP